jgi:hypothetical protein
MEGAGASAAVVVIVMLVDGNVERPVGLIVGARPDLDDVDAVARLELAAKRLGYRLCLRGVAEEFRQLLELVGLGRLVPPA